MKTTIRLFSIVIAFLSVTVTPTVRAVDPPPDGGYPNQNTAEGEDALFNLTSGQNNTAVGFNALFNDTTGIENTAIGSEALLSNTIGFSNTATGKQALTSNIDGFDNTATGVSALVFNTAGSLNTAIGFEALFFNTAGSRNTAVGYAALLDNTTGADNTASGISALSANTTGENNTAAGDSALNANTTGSGNIALGANAGSRLTTGDNNIDIGNAGARDESNTIRIGTQGTQTKTFIAGINNAAIRGIEVRVNQNGRLGTLPSSKCFKDEIKPIDKASEVILELKPVTFRYKPEIDPEGAPQFGLIAEEVEKVNPDLVARDAQGKPYTVRYDAVNAMLLNEFLKARRQIDVQQKQIEALTAGLQKVNAQVELGKSAPQAALNNR